MSKAFENIPVKNMFCGFVDVLGFGAATLIDHQEAVEVYERFLEHFENIASGFKREDGKISVYSDAFIIVSELPRLRHSGRTLVIVVDVNGGFPCARRNRLWSAC
jgi:hypothetical protein